MEPAGYAGYFYSFSRRGSSLEILAGSEFPDPSTPVGRYGNPLGSMAGNLPTTINGRPFSCHSIDQMQARRIPSSVVANTIKHSFTFPGNTPGTVGCYDAVNNVSVIINFITGNVITVRPGWPRTEMAAMEEQWKNDFDQRQYVLMGDHLHRYEEGRVDLGSLIAGLEGLLQCLEAVDEGWKDDFFSKWGILEEVYAVALDRAEHAAVPNVDTILEEPDNKKLIAQAIENIRRHLAGQLLP